jgi:uncharacterized alkaline shock family protein YloU
LPIGSRYGVNSTGRVTYGNKVLFSIISLAVEEITGVAGLFGKGIRVDVNNRVVSVDVYITVTAKVSCTDVAFRVQENVKRSVESMTEYKTDIVNVNIMGLTFDED